MLGYGAFDLGGTSQNRSLRLTQPTGSMSLVGWLGVRCLLGLVPRPSKSMC